ncbi:SDR family NAD(P)-dependent oxidoreductase [Parafrankia sp. BMG5.11]|uniref:SDR family NAD(P)-dependent oxidoreductase n=1 Tax=Parafrankia sp. BMG5.11 TaxID=222540 RepID=UPI000DD2C44F|nr:SDR family oxidoreductase [Parafrankia sp. BMG5.11]TCJ33524.1 SDR family oxidoreductase [Parafrankia sp. BMG5.11]
MLLERKSAVITGAGSGVGRASALRFAKEGALVVCTDIRLQWAKETVRQIEAAGGVAIPQECDVASEQDVAATVAAAVERFGRLDIMFNNAGIPAPRRGKTIEDHTIEEFERITSVNLRGVFLGCKYAVAQFKKQGDGGVILNTGSVAGLVGLGDTIYGATKGGVHQLTRGVAIECAPFGIRVNAICPSGMPYTTNFTAAGGTEVPPDALEQYAERVGSIHPLGKPIRTEDCAEAAVYLVSDRAANITGVLLPVDGGYVAR